MPVSTIRPPIAAYSRCLTRIWLWLPTWNMTGPATGVAATSMRPPIIAQQTPGIRARSSRGRMRSDSRPCWCRTWTRARAMPTANQVENEGNHRPGAPLLRSWRGSAR
ncbi:hypothetical protein ASG88_13690 [Nocardioides sp. Soil777]|nr:hypothetical protein ASG88_13690 [Nocardioides sp. Soil777]